MIDQRRLRPHHVADGHDRESAGSRAGRSSGSVSSGPVVPMQSAEHVDADDEVARRIEHLARADDALPPAVLAGHRMCGRRRTGRRSAAWQIRTAFDLSAFSVAVGLVGDAIGSEIDAAVEPQRPVRAQDRVAALGERLALGIGQVVQHCPLPRRSQRKSPRPEGRGLFSEHSDLLAMFNVVASRSAQIPRRGSIRSSAARGKSLAACLPLRGPSGRSIAAAHRKLTALWTLPISKACGRKSMPSTRTCTV